MSEEHIRRTHTTQINHLEDGYIELELTSDEDPLPPHLPDPEPEPEDEKVEEHP